MHVSRLDLQLSLRNLLKPGVKSRMEMLLEQRRQAMLQLHLRDQRFIAWGASYILGLTVRIFFIRKLKRNQMLWLHKW